MIEGSCDDHRTEIFFSDAQVSFARGMRRREPCTLHLGWEETEPPSEEMALDFLPVEPPSPLGIISEATTMCGPMNLGIGRTASVMN